MIDWSVIYHMISCKQSKRPFSFMNCLTSFKLIMCFGIKTQEQVYSAILPAPGMSSVNDFAVSIIARLSIRS